MTEHALYLVGKACTDRTSRMNIHVIYSTGASVWTAGADNLRRLSILGERDGSFRRVLRRLASQDPGTWPRIGM